MNEVVVVYRDPSVFFKTGNHLQSNIGFEKDLTYGNNMLIHLSSDYLTSKSQFKLFLKKSYVSKITNSPHHCCH